MLNCSVVSNSLQPHGLCNLPGSSVHKIFQATILDVLSFPTPGDLPNQWTKHSSLAFPAPVGGFFYHCVIWKPINVHILAVIMQQNTMEVYRLKDFPGISAGKESACNSGDPGLISGSGRTPGEGNGNPLQYSCLKNPMDGGAWQATVYGVTKDQTRLSNFTFFSFFHNVESEATSTNFLYCYIKIHWSDSHTLNAPSIHT